MKNQAKRSTRIDIMKGLMMLAVMLYHLVYRKQDSLPDLLAREAIYLSMPLFMLLAGYFYREGRTLRNRLKAILKFPVLSSAALLLIFGPYYIAVYIDFTAKSWLSDIVLTYLRPEFTGMLLPSFAAPGQLFNNLSPVWFVWTLAWSTVVFYVAVKLSSGSIYRSGAAAAVLIAAGTAGYLCLPPLSWNLQIVPLYAGIMMIGHLLSIFEAEKKSVKVSLPVSLCTGAAAGLMHVYIFRRFGSDLIYLGILGEKDVYSALMFVLQVLVGGYALCVLAGLIEKAGLLREPFSFIGRHTMVFLMFHCLIGGVAADLMHTYNKLGPNWYLDPLTAETVVKSWISFALSMAGCTLLSLAEDRF